MKILKNYLGRDGCLTDERLQHILEHPELASKGIAIEDTLKHPQFVIQSLTDPDAELSYRFYFGTQVGDKWLCVVVSYAIDDAFVITGYLTDKIKKGVQLWPKK